MTALTNWVMAGAQTQSVVLAFEDLHWADPTMLDVLRGIAERGALAPLYGLTTTRPEFRPPWGMRSHHSTISLAPLDHQQVRHMVGGLAARHALPQQVVEDVLGSLRRRAAVRGRGDAAVIGARASKLALKPSRRRCSNRSWRDSTGLAGPREVAQVGSVIGGASPIA